MGYLYRKDPNDKKGKWSDVFKVLLIFSLGFLVFRWILWEPFVIPSGSMKETLLIQDYVVVRKWQYGVRLPFTQQWLVGPFVPERGDIVVFKSVGESGHTLVKRVIGLPGDEILINEKGFIQINDSPFVYQEVKAMKMRIWLFTKRTTG
jgi:signal peptidase I